ncbi:maltose/moltooligosaccharide transporter [Thermoflavifilum thermophilum]|uniref:Maltose/moltooligosaccharide transporter n=2 Tax=Thermoflavifilum thermophilum TaxID=1393122 RepID=A0A1I7NKP5_9BACT|nr:maltose/moltooligosaccharide transporter [Thermoflavifilum thermophilum]
MLYIGRKLPMPPPVQRPHLGFRQIWNMSVGFFGIQIGFALQNANASRIFQTLGASIDHIPILWIAAPVTGLLVQPIIGYLSDRTWHRFWGRRRPYFFVGSLLAALALVLMPNSRAVWQAAVMLWLMDASINITMEPFRAFVGDQLPSSQRTLGFAMQTFFIGLGAVLGSQFPYLMTHVLHVSNAVHHHIPLSVKYAFYLGAACFFAAVSWTVFTTREYPPDDMEAWKTRKQQTRGLFASLREIGKGFVQMPRTMLQLAVVQFFTWIAFFALWIYTTSAVAQQVYHTTDAQSQAFQDAGDWVGVLFSVYNGVSAFMAFLLPWIARTVKRTYTHLICLFIGSAGLISIYFIHQQWQLIWPMLAIGLAWASTLTMPYAILAGALPPEKMGFYMGVFNFFIVIPQILAAVLLGFLIRFFFHNESIYAMLIGGGCMLIAALMNLIVSDRDDQVKKPFSSSQKTKTVLQANS